MEISHRHDRRLTVILTHLDSEEASAEPVTTKQVEAAWNVSSNLVSFDY
jgi:hypothetical protein